MSKTWKAAKKRIKITHPAIGTGKKQKLLKKMAGQNHFNTKERSGTAMGKRRNIQMRSNISIPYV